MSFKMNLPMLILAALFFVLAAPHNADAACQVVNGTQDGGNKQRAVEKSRATLEDAIVAMKKRPGWANASVTPVKVRAIPLWKMVRTSVPKDAYLRPDVISGRAYTVCWEGVYSPAVCSSGAKLCQR